MGEHHLPPTKTRAAPPARLIRLGIFVLVVLPAVAAAAWLWTAFRPTPVVEHKIYRGRQPSGEELCSAARRLGLRSVVNLRGADPAAAWYLDELEASRRCGLDHLDVRFWTEDWPPRAEVHRLIRFLERAEPPVLMHCLGGEHRSGWAAAVARLLEGDPYDRALAELSSAPRSLGRASAGYDRRFFELYEAWLAERATPHDRDAFRDWALTRYFPPPYAADLELLQHPALEAVAPGTWLLFRVRAGNRSTGPWALSAVPGHGFRLGAEILGPFDERPADLPSVFRGVGRPGADVARSVTDDGSIAPGESHDFELSFLAPESPGLYVVHLDMVEEQVHWFSDLGSDGILLDLRVVSAPR